MSKSTLSLIEDIVTYRDRISERADRDMLADVANELSSLNALKAELLEALAELAPMYEAVCQNLGGMVFGRSEIQRDLAKASAAIAKAASPSASIGGE